MILYARGTATIEHGETSEQFAIYDEELEWEPISGSERSMGQETIYQALVDHDELGELRWTVTEYPVGAENFKETDVGKHRVMSRTSIMDWNTNQSSTTIIPQVFTNALNSFPIGRISLTQSAMADHLVKLVPILL